MQGAEFVVVIDPSLDAAGLERALQRHGWPEGAGRVQHASPGPGITVAWAGPLVVVDGPRGGLGMVREPTRGGAAPDGDETARKVLADLLAGRRESLEGL